MTGICTSPYPIEKVINSPYSYPYPVSTGIPRQSTDVFGQYLRGQIYLPCLVKIFKLNSSFGPLIMMWGSFWSHNFVEVQFSPPVF